MRIGTPSYHVSSGGRNTINSIYDPADIFGGRRERQGNALNESYDSARQGINTGYQNAGNQLQQGYNQAQNSVQSGFNQARQDSQTGYGQARNQLQTGYNTARQTAQSNFDTANAQYNTPEMVASRSELYNRILGKGGLSDDTVNQMQGKAREEYGTAARGAENSLKRMYGDSGAAGLQGENMARAYASLGAERANSTRDITMANEQLKRQEQTGAIGSTQAEAASRAGLYSQQGEYLSGLEARAAEGGANLTATETGALSQLAAMEGTTMADLQARLGSGQAGLSQQEANILAELSVSQATNGIAIQNSGGLSHLIGQS